LNLIQIKKSEPEMTASNAPFFDCQIAVFYFGSKGASVVGLIYVRFSPKSGHC